MKKSIILNAPTWSCILPALLAVYKDGSPKGSAFALEELRRMAAIADLYVSEHLDLEKLEGHDHD